MTLKKESDFMKLKIDRLENDILVTANGPDDLMKNIPIESDEIEELMNS